jgi:hypothetical protein
MDNEFNLDPLYLPLTFTIEYQITFSLNLSLVKFQRLFYTNKYISFWMYLVC